MTNERKPQAATPPDPWQQHQLSQLRYFRSLTLRQKFEVVEGMADVVHKLESMRKQGQMKSGDSEN